MIGGDGRGRVGKGQGHWVVPGGVSVGTTVGVVVGVADADGFGGVFRLGGGVLDSCTIVVFGNWLGAVLGTVL